MFKDYYRQWRKEIAVYQPPHPYKQFRERFEPQNEEEEELLELENQSKPRISGKKLPDVEGPVKGPAKWHKPQPKVMNVTKSKQPRLNYKGFKNEKVTDHDNREENRNTKKIMKFQPFSEDELDENQARSYDKSVEISDKAAKKLVWKRVDDSVENRTQNFDQDDEISDKPTKKLAWKGVDTSTVH